MGFDNDSIGFYSDSMGYEWDIPSGKLYKKQLNMAIEIVSCPMKHGDFP